MREGRTMPLRRSRASDALAYRVYPPSSRVEGTSQVNLPQMQPLRDGICMRDDHGNHPFAPGLPPGRVGVTMPLRRSRASDALLSAASTRLIVRKQCVGSNRSEFTVWFYLLGYQTAYLLGKNMAIRRIFEETIWKFGVCFRKWYGNSKLPCP